MGVSYGSPVSSANSNAAWISKNADDTTVGKLGMANTDPVSGPSTDNAQRDINGLNSFTGRASEDVYNSKPTWTNNDVGLSSDDLKTRTDGITQKFNSSAGHTHSGTAGDAPPIPSVNVSNVQLKAAVVRATDIASIAASSTSVNVTSLMTGNTPSTGVTIKGWPVNNPYNLCPMRDSNGNEITHGTSGEAVYGRLTESSGTWTLTFYYLNSGVETSYSFTSTHTNVQWYSQVLVNPITDPGYNYDSNLFTPSANTTADVLYATTTVAGKVLLSSSAPPAVGTGDLGSATDVSRSDHTHDGVSSIASYGNSAMIGAVVLKAGTGLTMTQTSGQIEIDATGASIGYQEIPAGPSNGVNTSFGPLTYTPATSGSVVVFLDGIAQDSSLWSLSGTSIIFTTAPAYGQSVYVFYLTNGTPTVPPAPSGTIHTEFRTLTPTEITNGKLTLANTPASPGTVLVDVIAGSAQEFNVDYTVVSNELRWVGYALDGVLTTGDKLRVFYQS